MLAEPAVELQINCFDRVIGTVGEELAVKHKHYADAVEEIVAQYEEEEEIIHIDDEPDDFDIEIDERDFEDTDEEEDDEDDEDDDDDFDI